MVSIDRKRGMLSKSDREYALNTNEWAENKSRAAAGQREKAIIERLRHGMFDFQHLVDERFPEELLEAVFFQSLENTDSEYDTGKPEEREGLADFADNIDPEVEKSCIAAVALIYRIYKTTKANKIIEKGVKRAVQDFHTDTFVVDASYDPNLKSPELAHTIAKNKLESEASLTDSQIKLLLARGEVDPKKVALHVQKGHTRDTREENILLGDDPYRKERNNPDNINPNDFPKRNDYISDRYSVDDSSEDGTEGEE